MPDRQIAIITGATSGIGRSIALGLARADKHVVMIARDEARGLAAQAWIKNQIPNAETDLMLVDLSSIAATRNIAREISGRYPQISLLVNNAGVFLAKRDMTGEGHERVLATNHLSPFVLARELEPALRAAGQARIVTIGSDTSDKAKIDPDNLELTIGWGFVRAYAQSKLAQMITTFEMARRLAGSGVTANVVHPGAVATGLVRTPGIIGLSWKMMAPFLLTESQGADTPLHVALAPELVETTGLYFKKRKAVPPNPRALDPGLAAWVWTATERLL